MFLFTFLALTVYMKHNSCLPSTEGLANRNGQMPIATLLGATSCVRLATVLR